MSAPHALPARVRHLVDQAGRAELRLADGARTSELRVVAWRGDLLVLAPRPNPLTPDLDDPLLEVAACARVFDTAAEDGWVLASFAGWISRVPADLVADAVLAFAERHPTTDLLGLGETWDLLALEVSEALVSGDGDVATLEGGAAGALLAA